MFETTFYKTFCFSGTEKLAKIILNTDSICNFAKINLTNTNKMMGKYDVFISYSRKDYKDENNNIIEGNAISKLKNTLKKNNISFWFDEDGIYSGDAFAPVIAKNIRSAKIFIFVSSENSNKSEWTGNEIATAHEFKKKIIPFRIDDSTYNESVILYIAKLDYIN